MKAPRDMQPIDVIAASAVALVVIAVVVIAKLAAEIVAPTVLAGLFALTLSPLVRSLERQHVPSAVAAAAVVGAGILGTLAVAYTVAPSAEDWRSKAPTVIRSIERQYRNIEREIEKSVDQATAGRGGQLNGEKSPADAVIESGQQLVADAVMSAPQTLLWLVYIGFLSYFLLAERSAIRRRVLALAADPCTRLHVGRAMRDMRQNVSRYLLTITAINALLGTAATAVFWALGLPNAPLWGVMVALLNFMPYIGPMISNVVVLVVGLASFSDPGDALLPVAALFTLNLVEGQFFTPLVVGRRSQVGPLAVFLALAFGAWLWGATGALVASPVLIVVVTLSRRLSNVPRRTRREPEAEAPRAAARAA